MRINSFKNIIFPIRRLILICYVVLIFIISPYLPKIVKKIQNSCPNNILFSEITVIILFLILYIFFIIYRQRYKNISTYILSLIIGIVIYGIIKYERNTIEHVHLIEYGILSSLIYLNIIYIKKDNYKLYKTIFLTFSIGVIIGLLDELYQGYLPTRVFDIRDCVVNTIGVICGLLIIVGVFRLVDG